MKSYTQNSFPISLPTHSKLAHCVLQKHIPAFSKNHLDTQKTFASDNRSDLQ